MRPDGGCCIIGSILRCKKGANMKNKEVMLETERLVLRNFTENDIEAIERIFGDEEINRFLPWFPVKNRKEAEAFFQERYASQYAGGNGRHYAVCLKTDNIPIGYVNVSGDDSRDFGYGLLKEFWGQGIITEAGRAALEQAKRDGLPFVTATHDIENSKSGAVLKRLGMKYCYTYKEQWQPKDIPVFFRMYQLNLDGDSDRVYKKYWEQYEIHFVEDNL